MQDEAFAVWRISFGWLKKMLFCLLVPDAVMSGLRYLICSGSPTYHVKGSMPTFWYLEALFVLVVLLGAVDLSIKKTKIREPFPCAVALSGICLFICTVMAHVGSRCDVLIIRQTCDLLPYFIGGVITSRSGLAELLLARRKQSFLLAVAFFALFLVSFQAGWITTPWLGIATAICFAASLPNAGILVKCLSLIGVASIHIYILHTFLKPLMLFVGSLIGFEVLSCRLTAQTYGLAKCFAFQLTMASLVSVLMILACVIVAKVVSKTSLVSKVMFGRELR